MAYATQKEREYLAERGWQMDTENECWYRNQDGRQHAYSISPVWRGKKFGDKGTPAPEYVFWAAVALTKEDSQCQMVVQFKDQCQSPITCFVLAELRDWRQV